MGDVRKLNMNKIPNQNPKQQLNVKKSEPTSPNKTVERLDLFHSTELNKVYEMFKAGLVIFKGKETDEGYVIDSVGVKGMTNPRILLNKQLDFELIDVLGEKKKIMKLDRYLKGETRNSWIGRMIGELAEKGIYVMKPLSKEAHAIIQGTGKDTYLMIDGLKVIKENSTYKIRGFEDYSSYKCTVSEEEVFSNEYIYGKYSSPMFVILELLKRTMFSLPAFDDNDILSIAKWYQEVNKKES